MSGNQGSCPDHADSGVGRQALPEGDAPEGAGVVLPFVDGAALLVELLLGREVVLRGCPDHVR